MVNADQIIAVVDQVAAKHHPLKIMLFGSYAYGTPNEDSDIDLMILTRSNKSNHQQFVEFRQTLHVDFPMDLVVRRESDVVKRIRLNDFF